MTVNKSIMVHPIYILSKCCYFYSWKNSETQKYCGFHLLSVNRLVVFNIDNTKCLLSIKSDFWWITWHCKLELWMLEII